MDANATHSDRVAFYLTGRRAEGLRDVGALRPALQARYRDLSSLRHDFPLVLATSGDAAAPSLTALVDAALASIAKGVDAERTRRQVLRVEQEVRVLLQHGAEGTLGKLWSDAVERLAAGRDASFAEAARRARAAIAVDGPLLRCDAELPERSAAARLATGAATQGSGSARAARAPDPAALGHLARRLRAFRGGPQCDATEGLGRQRP